MEETPIGEGTPVYLMSDHSGQQIVVAKVRERLAVSKQTTHTVQMERFNLKKLNEVEAKDQYRVEISNRFAALENLDTKVDVNKAWETIRENIKMSAKESLGRSVSHGSMNDAQNYYIKESRPNCKGYRIQAS
ncbi:hypothetical protein B7P43_G11233 [Cryptotermes secundus]|uniref:Uncharacterized protein n=1 Tax=Cryptotermes secundus TaxID=105785 RepID=A0A2J7PRX2_9NEOP|nr:hypothetical protein B7P43_G11233 [Cryptotermes secundus]